MEKSLDVQPIILAAGKGTRMNSALPKVLVGLKGKPLIQHLLDNLNQISLAHPPVVVIGHKYELVQSYLGPKFTYAFQEGQLGTAHAVSAAKSKVTAPHVLVLYGDMPFIGAPTLINFLNRHIQEQSVFSMLTTRVPNFKAEFETFNGFGRIIRDVDGNLLKIQEFVAASPQEREIREVNPGIYAFNTNWLWPHIDMVQKNKQGEYYLTDLVEIAIKSATPIATAEISPMEVFGINTAAQLQQAEQLLVY